jgi:flagellar hook protein FlgE
MSFFTSLTGLDAANADLGIISNNIANVSTYGFKQSSAQFGDIYATSPLQNATSTIGQGVLLKGVTQDFSQGNITSSSNSLDMAIQGQGFFMLKPNLTANTQVYTRDGSFSVNNNRYVVDSAGQYVQVFPVNSDGSVVATGLQSAQSLQLPTTSGLPKASSQIQLGVNLPSDATIIPQESTYTSGGAQYAFDPNNANTYNQSTSITVYDSLGNPSIATIYYVKTSNATPTDPTNKWQTYIYIGGNQINPALLGAQTTGGKQIYINQFGQTTEDPSTVDPTFNASSPHALYYQDQQNQQVASQAASFTGGIINSSTGSGFNFGSTDSNTIVVGASTMSSTQSGNWIVPTAGTTNEEYNLSISPQISAIQNWTIDLGSTIQAQQLNFKGYDPTGTATTPITVDVQSGDSAATIAQAINTAANGMFTATAVNIGNNISPDWRITVSTNATMKSEMPTSFVMSSSLTTANITGTPMSVPALDVVSTVAGQTITAAQLDNMLQAQSYATNFSGSAAESHIASTSSQTLTITGGSASPASFNVNIAAGATLAQIVNSINTAAVTSGAAVTAALVNTGTSSAPNYTVKIFAATNNPNTNQTSTSQPTATFTVSSTDSDFSATAQDSMANTLEYNWGIGTTGSAINGNQTFYDIAGTTPFTINVNSTFGNDSQGGIAGGFTGTAFSSASAQVGSTVPSQQGISTSQLFKISVDGSDPVEVSLPSSLDGLALTGEQLATALTTAVNNRFGDSQYINIDNTSNSFNLYASFDPHSTSGPMQTNKYGNPYATGGLDSSNTTSVTTLPNQTFYNSDGSAIAGSTTVAEALQSKFGVQIVIPTGTYTAAQLVTAAQKQVDDNLGPGHIQVSYDTTSRSLAFKPYDNADGITSIGLTGPLQTVGVSKPTSSSNETLGFAGGLPVMQTVGAGNNQGQAEASAIVPNGAPIQNPDQRRYGIQVVYQKDTGTFNFLSGTTGQNSSITVGPAGNVRAANLLGISSTYSTQISTVAGSGLPSTAAVTTGSKATIDISGTFAVTNADNTINVTVNGVQGQVVIPPGAYTGTTFATAIQNQINEITNSSGQSVGGVTVTYNPAGSNFVFTSGTTGTGSNINVVGPAAFGLANCSQTQGTVPNVTILKQATDSSGNLLYIDSNGNETTNKPTNLPNWTPLYLTPGELTFNTAGNLISPQQGAQYTPYDPQNGANPITLNVNYGKYSTQYSQPFSVLSLSQDGYTSGSLSGINIDSTGVVRATYTNGQQQALGKVVLANFSSPTGLKQLGNSDYVATSLSGPPTTGEAGSSGFGTIQGGALEESNVDMTSELVSLITAQRNFQANAKAIETDTQLTSTIINIRS